MNNEEAIEIGGKLSSMQHKAYEILGIDYFPESDDLQAALMKIMLNMINAKFGKGKEQFNELLYDELEGGNYHPINIILATHNYYDDSVSNSFKQHSWFSDKAYMLSKDIDLTNYVLSKSSAYKKRREQIYSKYNKIGFLKLLNKNFTIKQLLSYTYKTN